MSHSPAIFRRLALALLLPLYMQTTNMYELAVVIFATLAIELGVFYFISKVSAFQITHLIFGAILGTGLTSVTVNHTVQGPWTRLLITYIFSLDALWELFPDFKAKQNKCVQMFINRLFDGDKLRHIPVVSAITVAVALTSTFVHFGVFNLNADWYWVMVGCLMVSSKILYLLLIVAIAWMEKMEPKTGRSKIGMDALGSVTAQRDNKAKDVEIDARIATGLNKSASDEGTAVSAPKTQKRPSTRRRG